MHLFVFYTITGLVLGGGYGIAASGLVVTYNTSGIFNFAHGAEAMLGAFAYWELRFHRHVPAPLALVVVLGLFAPLMGTVICVGVMRRLADATEVTKVVGTVALTLGILYLADWAWNPAKARTDEMFFGARSGIRVFRIIVPTHDVVALASAVAMAVGLWAFMCHTRKGVAMRGAVDDPDLLQLNGHDPARLSALSWAVGSVLAVLAGVLITPISGGALDAGSLTLLVINAFAAAMFGRLRSVPRTFVGGIVLGVATSYVLAYFPTSWSWVSNFRISLPMIVLFVVLLVLRQERLRGTTYHRLPDNVRVASVRSAVAGGAALVIIVALLRPLMVAPDVAVVATGLSFAVIALSLTLLTGYAGEMNLAAASFSAIGTLVAFHVGTTGHGLEARMSPWAVVLAVAVCVVMGALVALPAIRLRGLYLALATMAFAVFLTDMVLLDNSQHKLPLLHWRFSLFPQGTLVMRAPTLGPLDLHDPTTLLMVTATVFATVGVGLIALRNSSYGRRLAAMKDSPVGTAMLGQSVVRLKLTVFMLSAGIAGLGGVLMAVSLGSVNSDNFSIFVSLSLLVLTVVAGISDVSGALFGGLVAGAGLGVVVGTLNDLAERHASLHGFYSAGAHVATILPVLVAVGIARHPTSSVQRFVQRFRPLAQAPPILIGGGLAEATLYILTAFGFIATWWFALLTVALVASLPSIGARIMPKSVLGADEVARRRRVVPVELLGIDTPYTVALRDAVDRALGLETPPTTYIAESGRCDDVLAIE